LADQSVGRAHNLFILVFEEKKMTEQQYIDLFTAYRQSIDEHSVRGLNKEREAAFDAFLQTGFPTTTDEDFNHSDVARLFDANYGLNLRNVPLRLDPYDIYRCGVPNLSTYLYFLINERFHAKTEQESLLPDGVFVGSLQVFSEKYPELFSRHYAKIADYSGNGTVAYNTMFAQDGFAVYVPKNVAIEKPLQLINILRGKVDMNINRRVLIIAEENAKVKLLACDHAVDDVKFLATQVVEVYAGRNAQVDYCEMEENSEKVSRVSAFFCKQEENSSTVTTAITLHNGYTRNDYRFRLLGKHAEAQVGGLAICDKEQHIDNFAFLDHAVSNCNSNELFKYVLQEKSTGVFCGKILVEKDAQKTQAYQNNRNLCVSEDAHIYSKPQLEIYADDVKCSHGLSTGQLDEDALFYMRARGIDKDEARLLLMVAFAQDVVDMIRIASLRERIEILINKRFRGELMRCGNCDVCK
jgi:Fe-S cluster assembly protein SufD